MSGHTSKMYDKCSVFFMPHEKLLKSRKMKKNWKILDIQYERRQQEDTKNKNQTYQNAMNIKKSQKKVFLTT